MLTIERFRQIIQSPKRLEVTNPSQSELGQISEDAKLIRKVGTTIAVVSLPILAGSCVVGVGLNYPGPNVDWDLYAKVALVDIAAAFASLGTIYLGLQMREKAKDALNFVQSCSPKQ